MSEAEVVFDNTVDALFKRALGAKLTVGCKQRLKEAGLDLSAPLQPSYPRPLYYRCLHIVAEELHKNLSTSEAMFKLGEAFILGFNETLLGRAVISVVKMLGTRRSLGRMTQNFRSSNSYMQTRLTELAPTSYELWLSQVTGVPDYFRGVLQTALTISGAKELSVRVKQSDGTEATLAISWKER